MTYPTSTIQDILHRRQQETFVGRAAQIERFRDQLTLSADDPRRLFVLSVAGQGGVGKSTLLRQYLRLAAAEGAAVALSTNDETDLPAALARLAVQLRDAPGGDAFRPFNERYTTYRRHRGELEASSDAPPGLAGLLGRASVRLGGVALRAAVPGAGLAFDLLEEPLADQAGQWAEFVRRKLGNRDEVQLVLEPATVLSPLFVDGLRVLADGRRVGLLFDTYELTASFLDEWLRDLLAGRYGTLPGGLTIVVAGRHELDRNVWAELDSLVGRLSLDPFTEAEARDYLARRGIVHEQVIGVILTLSGRLPLLLTTLASQSPDDPARVGDATGTAVERFLKWVDDPARRALALNGALPRRLNRDVVGLLGDAADFDWLCANPFVERRTGAEGWAYHSVAREQMLRYKRVESPAEWMVRHEALAEHYRVVAAALALDWHAGAHDPAWRAAAREYHYHRLCAQPAGALGETLNAVAEALGWPWAKELAETLSDASRDADSAALRTWSERLREARWEQYDEEGIEALRQLAAVEGLETAALVNVLKARSLTYQLLGNDVAALADLSRIVELEPQNAWHFSDRGWHHLQMHRYDEALADFSRAIELEPQNASRVANRAWGFVNMQRYDEALIDFSHAIEVAPRDAYIIAERGEIYKRLGRYDDALADFNRAIDLEPQNDSHVSNHARAFLDLERYDDALAVYDHAIELRPNNARRIAERGDLYMRLGRYAQALGDYDRVIELEPHNANAIISLGEVYGNIGRYEEALVEFERAHELDPNNARAVAVRGVAYRLMGRYKEALTNLDRAIELNPRYAYAITHRAITYQLMGRNDESLANYGRAIELEPRSVWLISERAKLYRRLGRYDEALADYDRAIELEPQEVGRVVERAALYDQLGRYDEALVDYSRAIELTPRNASTIYDRGMMYRRLGRYSDALADFDRAVQLRPRSYWGFYQRALTRYYLDPDDDWKPDLERAHELATAAYERDPSDMWNLFNLALCNLFADDGTAADALYTEALAAADELARREALRDLDDYLLLFPDNAQAARWRERLEEG